MRLESKGEEIRIVGSEGGRHGWGGEGGENGDTGRGRRWRSTAVTTPGGVGSGHELGRSVREGMDGYVRWGR